MWGCRATCASAVAAVIAAAAAAMVVTVAVVEVVALPGRQLASDNADASAQLAVSAAAAAAAAKLEKIPFPSPPPGRSAGRFHTLPSLQCRLHPTQPGGVSPDPNAVHNPYGRGGTGWQLQVNGSDPVIIPYAAGTCASPLNDEFQLACVAAPEQMNRLWGPRTCRVHAFEGEDAGTDFIWEGYVFYSTLSSYAKGEAVTDSHIGSEYFRPHPCAKARRRSGLVCEEEIAAMISLRRNLWQGEVERHSGPYDVLSVGRASIGMALDKAGQWVAATDRVSNVSGNGDYDIVMHTAPNGRRRPVLAGDAAMLSLGRAVMADPAWLGGSFPGGFSSIVHLLAVSDGVIDEDTTWSLDHRTGAINSSRWLPAIARTMCKSPSSSFVVDSSFCDGVDEPRVPRLTHVLEGKHPVVGSLSYASGQHSGSSEQKVTWMIERSKSSAQAPPCNSSELASIALRRPMWLFGRGDRELHVTGSAGGSAELDLALDLSSCKYDNPRWDLNGYRHMFDGRGLTARLSQQYRRAIFQVDPPDDPISDTELILALVVVVPEAVAIVLLMLQRHNRQSRWSRWYWREWSSLVVIVVAGAVALLGVGCLDRREHLGHAWRAAAVRQSRRIPANATEDMEIGSFNVDYSGRVVADNERLIIIARTGYRPHLTRKLLLISIASYAGLTMVVLLRWAVAIWWKKRVSDQDVEHWAVDTTPPARPRRLPWQRRSATHSVAAENDPPVDRDGGGCCGSRVCD